MAMRISFKTWLEAEEEEPVMTFGKHRDKKLSEVPDDYLAWMLAGDFRFDPRHGFDAARVQAELDKRSAKPATPKPTPTPPVVPHPGVPDKNARLREIGMHLLGTKYVVNLGAEQMQMLQQAVGPAAFSKDQFYSEGLPPLTPEVPGWVAFSFYGASGVISRWEWGKNFYGLSQLETFLRKVVADKIEKERKELEDFLFSYSSPDNTEFDLKREELNQLKKRRRSTISKVVVFVREAARYWQERSHLRGGPQ